MSTPETVVALEGVSKVFPKGGVTALDGIDLEVDRGEFISLIGPSGCGKSTLLRVIGDLAPPTAGEVLVNGKSAERARLDRDYGIVFQAAVLYDWRTVAKNIALPLELLKWSKAKRNELHSCWRSKPGSNSSSRASRRSPSLPKSSATA